MRLDLSDSSARCERDPYAGINIDNVRQLLAVGWAAGIVMACVLMTAAPPTAQFEQWGWLAAAGVQAFSAAGLIMFRRYQERAGFTVLLAITWLIAIDLGAMQWLAGGWTGPYHELLLPVLIIAAAGHPVRRFAALGAGVVVIALLPAVYAPDPDGLLGMVAELGVWSGVIGALSVLMGRVRAQRIAQEQLARCDQLTRLANRRALDEHFAGSRTSNVVLAIGDLNDFKHINDRYGHLAGDACLTEVAAVLSEHARAGDQVFRWGGDEFAVLLAATSDADARLVFERLEAAVAASVRDPGGAPVVITFGWADGGPRTDLRTLTSTADAMLLERKPRRGSQSGLATAPRTS
jgi:diguanylate cyclase (GGDEF)-like protein